MRLVAGALCGVLLLGAAFDRSMAWTGRELMLFDHELIPSPGAEGPTLTRAAALNLDSGTWRRLPDAPMLGTGPWLATGTTMVNPALGGADGGKIGDWGRTYPYGGIIDPGSGAWSPLPDPPPGDTVGGAARTGSAALYPQLPDAVLHTGTGRWEPVKALPGDEAGGRTVVAAGIRMVVFGGARNETLLDDAWTWTPQRQGQARKPPSTGSTTPER